MTRPKVYVVDDDPGIRAMLQIALDEGFEVHAFPDGKAARSALSLCAPAALPAVIVSDVRMPGLDGYSFQNELLANPATAAIPLVVITANREMVDMFRGAPNVFAFIEKPFDYKKVVETVERAAKQREGAQ